MDYKTVYKAMIKRAAETPQVISEPGKTSLGLKLSQEAAEKRPTSIKTWASPKNIPVSKLEALSKQRRNTSLEFPGNYAARFFEHLKDRIGDNLEADANAYLHGQKPGPADSTIDSFKPRYFE